MTPLSRRPLDKETEKKIEGIMVDELVKITNKAEMISLVESLLTSSEKLMLAKRLSAFVLIDEGWEDGKIANVLHLTRQTVGKFRLMYKYSEVRAEPVVKMVKEIKTSEKFLRYLVAAAGGRIPR